jgi:hypothetical protein
MDAHIQNERKITENEKSRYNDKFLVTTTLTPLRQHQKSNIFKKRRIREGNSAQASSSPVGFHLKKSPRS